MKKVFDQLKGSFSNVNSFCITIYALFITLFLLHEASKLVSFELTDLSAFYISEATAWGIDVSSRVSWMNKLIFGSAGIFLIIFSLLKTTFKNYSSKLIKHEDLLLLSISGIVLCVMKIFGTDSTHVLSSLFFVFCFKLLLVILSECYKVNVPKYLLHSGILNLSISFAFLFMFACVFLFGTTDLVHKNYSTIFFVGTLIFLFYYYLTLHIFKIGVRKATSYLLPLTGIPFIAVLSVETFFYKKLVHHQVSNYHHNFTILFIVFTVALMALLFSSRKKRRSSLKQYKRYIIPSLLFCYVVITAYVPVIDNSADMFEPANPLGSIMRVFQFGQIPCLDFMSSHMLSEQWYGYLYSAIFGFHNDLSPLSYGFLNSIIFVYLQYLLIYHLFKRETLAVAFIFLFPFVNEVFMPTILVATVPFLLTRSLFEKPTSLKVFNFLFTCVLLLIWRIDTGVVAIIGNAFFIPITYFLYSNKMPFKIVLKGFGYFFAFGLALFGLCCMIRSPRKVLDSVQLFYHYIAASQSHGHNSLFSYNTHQFYLYHVLYPLLAVGLLLYGIYLLKTKYTDVIFSKAYLLLSATYLFIMYLVHLQRGLVRHGFPELNDDYIIGVFHVSTGLLIAFLFFRELAIERYAIFYCSTFLIFLLVKYFPIQVSKIPIESGISESRFYNQKDPFDQKQIEGRVFMDSSFAQNNYLPMKKFMDRYLSKDQTFFDFSNTTMLYYYCNKNIPGYFNQNLQNTVGDFLQLKLLNKLDPEKIPLAIYSSYPPNVGDAMDDIANVMRHYILAEYVFSNYKPIGIINNKSVWATSKLASKIKDSLPQDLVVHKPQRYDYKLNAEYIGYYYSHKNSTDLKSVLKINEKDLAYSEYSYSFQIPKEFNRDPHCYLSIEFEKPDHEIKSYPITVELLNDSTQQIGSFTFERRDKVSNKYMLRLSNHYLWHISNTATIRISKDNDIRSIELLKDIRPEYKTTNIN